MRIIKPLLGTLLKSGNSLLPAVGWVLNEGPGNTEVYDLRRNKNDAVSSGGFSWASGKYGITTRFNGVNGLLTTARCYSPPSLPFTVIAGIKPDLSQTFRFADSDGANNYFGFRANVLNTGAIYDSYGDGLGIIGMNRRTAQSAGAVIGDGEQCVVAFVCRGAVDWSLYKNGIDTGPPIYSGTGGAYNPGTTAGHIGGVNVGGAFVYGKGDLDFLYVFNFALTSPEIALFYRESFWIYPENIMPEFGMVA